MLSIIIPTLNEQERLPRLLRSIKKQKLSDYEIIIADAGSKDKTVEIGKSFGCQIAPGGLPARARNQGAKIARGSTLLFLDADTRLPPDCLEKAVNEFEKRNLKIAGFQLLSLEKNKMANFFLYFFYNLPILILEKILPHAAMAILMDKKLFQKLKGFDETVKLAEDHHLARHAKKLAKFGVIKSTKVFVSIRRFQKDGWLRTGLKYFLAELYMIFIGPIRSDIFQYKFAHYKK